MNEKREGIEREEKFDAKEEDFDPNLGLSVSPSPSYSCSRP
jgi:hypothetical protein